jgi:hypothetical protein
MPTHKNTNEFIRKYNKQFAIKGYSKMSVSEKVKTIQNYVGKPGMSGMKWDWKTIMDKHPGYSGSAAKAPAKNTRTRKLKTEHRARGDDDVAAEEEAEHAQHRGRGDDDDDAAQEGRSTRSTWRGATTTTTRRRRGRGTRSTWRGATTTTTRRRRRPQPATRARTGEMTRTTTARSGRRESTTRTPATLSAAASSATRERAGRRGR